MNDDNCSLGRNCTNSQAESNDGSKKPEEEEPIDFSKSSRSMGNSETYPDHIDRMRAAERGFHSNPIYQPIDMRPIQRSGCDDGASLDYPGFQKYRSRSVENDPKYFNQTERSGLTCNVDSQAFEHRQPPACFEPHYNNVLMRLMTPVVYRRASVPNTLRSDVLPVAPIMPCFPSITRNGYPEPRPMSAETVVPIMPPIPSMTGNGCSELGSVSAVPVGPMMSPISLMTGSGCPELGSMSAAAVAPMMSPIPSMTGNGYPELGSISAVTAAPMMSPIPLMTGSGCPEVGSTTAETTAFRMPTSLPKTNPVKGKPGKKSKIRPFKEFENVINNAQIPSAEDIQKNFALSMKYPPPFFGPFMRFDVPFQSEAERDQPKKPVKPKSKGKKKMSPKLNLISSGEDNGDESMNPSTSFGPLVGSGVPVQSEAEREQPKKPVKPKSKGKKKMNPKLNLISSGEDNGDESMNPPTFFEPPVGSGVPIQSGEESEQSQQPVVSKSNGKRKRSTMFNPISSGEENGDDSSNPSLRNNLRSSSVSRSPEMNRIEEDTNMNFDDSQSTEPMSSPEHNYSGPIMFDNTQPEGITQEPDMDSYTPRRRKSTRIPDEKKDEAYWRRRHLNNLAAAASRRKRRSLEDNMATKSKKLLETSESLMHCLSIQNKEYHDTRAQNAQLLHQYTVKCQELEHLRNILGSIVRGCQKCGPAVSNISTEIRNY